MDIAITHWLNSAAGSVPLLDDVMITATLYGVQFMVLLVVVQWWSRADRTHVRHTALAAGLSFVLAIAINHVIILFIHRIRPYDAGVTHLIVSRSSDWSFPSDHSAAAMAIAAAFALQGLPKRTACFLILALLVCFSRIYVGSHYFTDVLGGIVTAFIAAGLVRLAYREGTRLDRFATAIL
jgi:undecaprenyl-diphosphatase